MKGFFLSWVRQFPKIHRMHVVHSWQLLFCPAGGSLWMCHCLLCNEVTHTRITQKKVQRLKTKGMNSRYLVYSIHIHIGHITHISENLCPNVKKKTLCACMCVKIPKWLMPHLFVVIYRGQMERTYLCSNIYGPGCLYY